jgi:8-oxo-dGTP diphosphatase
MQEKQKVEIGVAAITFSGDTVLITKRPDHAHCGGKWEFPGGSIEYGESVAESLSRELREELDIAVSIESLFGAVSHAYEHKKVHMLFFLCTFRSGEPKAIGCSEFRFVSPRELESFDFAEADRPILQKLQETWKRWGRPAEKP